MFQRLEPEHFQFQLASLPITLICHASGNIALVKNQQFLTIYEHTVDNVEIIIGPDSVKFVSDVLADNLEVEYNVLVDYRDKPLLSKWIKSFELQLPKFN